MMSAMTNGDMSALSGLMGGMPGGGMGGFGRMDGGRRKKNRVQELAAKKMARQLNKKRRHSGKKH